MPFAAALCLLARASSASPGLGYPLPPQGDPARFAIFKLEGLGLETRRELRALYLDYARLTRRLRDEGWEAGLLSGAVLEREEEPLLPARQLEEALKAKEADLRSLESGLDRAASREELKDLKKEVKLKRREVRALARRASRPKGLGMDWSDAVWAELRKAEAAEWEVFDQVRRAPPRHSAAVLCAPPRRHEVCLAFDPWDGGEPAVFEYHAWHEGGFPSRLPPEYFLNALPLPE